MSLTIRENIEQRTAETLLTMRENERPRDTSLDPYKPCPCGGVLRQEEKDWQCWGCGAIFRP